ncbi:hypothetical protein SAMN04488505_1029 [Chitinophaga rupis]|uniref:Uncharacterized protein n=1 Tax=Chitinophaga rupis TaxID=573321 RepID=A0A1H7P5U3_9BACT|nr:hypothetical protein SAMN04488505_1029 [Chitinophaga rupis]
MVNSFVGADLPVVQSFIVTMLFSNNKAAEKIKDANMLKQIMAALMNP